MTKKAKMVAIGMIVSVIFSCIGNANTITFLTPPWGIPPDEEALKAFQDKTGIHVEIISLPMSELYSRVQIASAAGRAPADVIFLSEEAPSFIVAPGFLEPLQARIAETLDLNVDEIERLDFWTINGNVYGLTTYVQLVMMDYNAERLARAGYEKPPETWDELVEMARTIKAQGVDEHPISFGAISWSWYLIALSMGDPMFNDALAPVFAEPGSKAREAFQLLITMFDEDLITREMLSKVTPHDLFMAGVGTFHQSWQGAHAVMNNPEVSLQAPHVRYMLLPEEHWTWSLDAAIGISKFSQHKEEAWKFVCWYLSPGTQLAIFDAYGLMPSRRSVQEELAVKGRLQQFELQQEQAKYVHQLPRYVPWWGPWDSLVTEKLRQVILGQLLPDSAVDLLAQEWNNFKTQYGY